MSGLYERDFCLWAEQQEEILISGNLEDLDRPYLAFELCRLGSRKRDLLVKDLYDWIESLLEWEFQRGSRTDDLKEKIRKSHAAIEIHGLKSPSLRLEMSGLVSEAYNHAVFYFGLRYNHTITPPELCPWTYDKKSPFGKAELTGETTDRANVTPLFRRTPRAASRE